jgi:acetyl esterase
VIGAVYLERGQPVTVVAGWGPGGGPRNVLVRRADGGLVVRPFRGLRRAAGQPRRQRAGEIVAPPG